MKRVLVDDIALTVPDNSPLVKEFPIILNNDEVLCELWKKDKARKENGK